MNQQEKELRDALRAKAFSGKNKPKGEVIVFHGAEIEIREQTLGVALSHIEAENDKSLSGADRAVRLLIDYAYVPGTNIKVFEPADIETLKNLPFNSEWINVQRVISKMMGLTDSDVQQVEEALGKNPLES